MSMLDKQMINTMSCPGCTEFYYFNRNIKDESITSVPILPISHTKTFEDSKNEITLYIAALLNSKGGVIVLDSEIKYMQVYPIGIVLTQDEKKTQTRAIE